MIFTYHTQNSVYQVDPERHLVRRVSGVNPTTEYVGTEGEWKKYESVTLADGCLLINWGFNLDKGAWEITLTSRVVSESWIEEIENG